MTKSKITKLSNQAIVLLTQFSQAVKNQIGIVKVSDMVNDHQYAFDIFVQTVLSEDDELVSLTLKTNNEVNIERHLVHALDHYFKAFKAKAKNEVVVQNNKSFLIRLASYLYGINVDGASYRQAVNQLISNEMESKKHFCIDVARSFYPFWVNARNELTKPSREQELTFDAQKESLMELWQVAEQAFVSPTENRKLRLYSEAIKQNKLADKEIEVRSKIAKVILIEQQSHTLSSEGYRDNIDNIQKLISSARLKDYILEVSREFYPFCLNT